MALLLAGCSTLESLNPITIWHNIEGGRIAEQRPPPPGSDAADPNLGSVPTRPAPPDREAMNRLTQGLVADRENARYSNAASPLPDPSSPNASPALFGAGTLPPPVKPATPTAPPAASASLPAASAPPEAPAAPPSPAPRKAVDSTPLAAPEQAVAAGEPPPLPVEPPPRAAAAPVPTPAPPAIVAPLAAAPQPAGANSTLVSFDPGSSDLTVAEADAVKRFAAQRKGATIAITGYGDAASADPSAQAAALGLAIRRAKTVSDALKAAGVPPAAIQTGGEAAGRGAFIRLLK
jgi:outer membrane protein OmpA-like peptidoglycan-associated protein